MKTAGETRNEHGSGTVITLGLILLGLGLMLTVAQLTVAASAVSACQKANDLAAIAGATSVLTGQDGCATAEEYAQKNGAELKSCTHSGWMLNVELYRNIDFGLVHTVNTKSRAGPEFAG